VFDPAAILAIQTVTNALRAAKNALRKIHNKITRPQPQRTAALAAYCQAWSRWDKAEEMLKSTGPVIKSKTTGAIYQNPYLAVANRTMKQMRDFLTEFGMTPSSRSRMSSGMTPVQDEKVEKFFGWCK
jgi:P27 family predicted phage terminase small subunit